MEDIQKWKLICHNVTEIATSTLISMRSKHDFGLDKVFSGYQLR